jgi:hypothetical protein
MRDVSSNILSPVGGATLPLPLYIMSYDRGETYASGARVYGYGTLNRRSPGL